MISLSHFHHKKNKTEVNEKFFAWVGEIARKKRETRSFEERKKGSTWQRYHFLWEPNSQGKSALRKKRQWHSRKGEEEGT